MGEAKRKIAAAISAAPKVRPTLDEFAVIAEAIRKVVGATPSFYGADCVAYALVGTEVLRRMGFDAKPIAGSAAWRVGPGDGDVLSHAVELHHQSSGAFAPNHLCEAGMFHAWIEFGAEIVDFTTYNFRDKARQLDAADGNKTLVQWAPEFLWTTRKACSPLSVVANGETVGAFSYVRSPAIEAVVLYGNPDFDSEGMADTVFTVLAMLKSGQKVRVIGVGDGEVHELDRAIANSGDKGLKLAEGSLLFGLPVVRGKEV